MQRFKIWWLLALTFILYIPSLSNPFIWDDEQFIYRNAYVQTFAVREIFTTNTVAGAGELSNYYRPLTTLSFAIDYQFWGLTPFGFHLTNILLHILAGWLGWRILRMLQIKSWAAIGITTLFLLSPIQTEAVTYINSRGDSLYAVFGLASILLLLLSMKGTKQLKIYNLTLSFNPWMLAVLAALSYAASILSKEIGLAVGGLLALVLTWKVWTRRSAGLSVWQKVRKLQPAVMAVILATTIGISYLVLRATVLNFQDSFNFYGDGSVYGDNLLIRLLTFSKIIWIYLQIFIFPYPLHMERNTELVTTLLSPWPWLTLALLGAISWMSWREWVKNKTAYVMFGAGWIAVMLLPVSGIVPINGLLYEHWLYLPIIGWGILIYGMLKLLPAIQQFLLKNKIILFSGLILINGLLTMRQNYLWEDPIRFYNHVLRYSETARVHNNLAMAYADGEKYDDALHHYSRGLELGEHYPQIYHNIGNAHMAKGDTEKAVSSFEAALTLNPTFFHSYYALLNLYIDRERYDAALELLQRGQTHLPTEDNFHMMEMIILDRMEHDTERDEKIEWIEKNLVLDAETSAFLETYYQK